MDFINSIISENLKRIRESKNLSLDSMAKLTGVSKSMLGQIERGESNPTVKTVWKIAKGLKITFTSLLSEVKSDTEVVKEGDIEPLIEDQGKVKIYPFVSYEIGRNFEVYRIVLEKDGYNSAESHGDGVYEFITVFSGELTFSIDDEVYSISKGNSIRFRADRSHTYHNKGSETVELSLVIHYPEYE